MVNLNHNSNSSPFTFKSVSGEVGTKYKVAKGFITIELSLELLSKRFSHELKFISQIKKFGILCLN